MNDTQWLSRFDELVESGLVSYDPDQRTTQHTEGNLTYTFILTSALSKKPTIHSTTSSPDSTSPSTTSTLRPGSDIDTTSYELGPVSPRHFLALNKFCYARPHLMLLTNDGHRRQHEALDSDDLSAAWSLLSAATIEDYVVFFNGGRDAGCSRMHKHLQLIPLPSSTFASSLDFVEGELPEPEVTFKWFYYRLSATPQTTPESLTEVYTTLLQKATDSFPQKPNGPSGGVCPHNFLLTKRWMLVIPRREWGISREAGVNAVGMIGVMPCSTRAEMESWIKKGVGEALAEVAVPR